MNSLPTATALRALLAAIIGDTSDRESRNRAFVFSYSAIGIVLISGFAVFHSLIGIYWLASLNCLVVTVGSLNVAALAKWGRLRIAENVSLLLLSFILLASLFGSVDQTGPYWFAVFPPIAFFLKGLRGGVLWVVGMLAILVGLAVLQQAGLVTTPVTVRALWLMIASVVTLCLVLAASQALLIDAEARLARRTRQLTIEIMERQSVEETLRRTEEKLRFMAHHDTLTGLPNRALFYDRLQQALAIAGRSRRRVGVLFLDLDHFKPVNDALGHAAGDQLLKEIAGRLRRELRQTDTVARIGGDEFTVILWDVVDRDAVTAIAAKLSDALSRPLHIEEREVRIGASIGGAVFPDDGYEADALLAAADVAMYRTKTARRQSRDQRVAAQADLFA